jgi:hypothetical protein
LQSILLTHPWCVAEDLLRKRDVGIAVLDVARALRSEFGLEFFGAVEVDNCFCQVVDLGRLASAAVEDLAYCSIVHEHEHDYVDDVMNTDEVAGRCAVAEDYRRLAIAD